MSAKASLATEWVSQGISQTSEDPAVQGGLFVSNGWLTAGIYGSNLDFGGVDANGDGVADASLADVEIDYSLGAQTIWRGVGFDFTYFYYSYPSSSDSMGDIDMWEIRGTATTETFWDTESSFAVFYTPEYSFKAGRNWTYEATLAKPLPALGPFSPTLSALIGYNDNKTGLIYPDFWFWNSGLTMGFGERFAVDVRYWDTDIPDCDGRRVFQCGERVVAGVSAEF